MKTFLGLIAGTISRRLLSGIFLISFCIYCNTLNAQNIGSGQNLYISMDDLGPHAKSFIAQNNIKEVATFDVVSVNSQNYLQVDTAKLFKKIKSHYPNASDAGIASLDWEGKSLVALSQRGPVTPEFQNALDAFLSVLKLAKGLRPNVKWGFYNVPFATYYNRNDSWKQSCANIEPLLKQCDVFFPTLYVPYKDGSIKSGDNESFAKDNILEALTLASNFNKPVLPFVWHRYHVSNKTIGLQLIPIDEFERYLNTILSVNYNGKKVAGLVWWGSDTYYYNIKSPALINEMSENNQTDFPAYHDNLIIKYGNEMLKTIKRNN